MGVLLLRISLFPFTGCRVPPTSRQGLWVNRTGNESVPTRTAPVLSDIRSDGLEQNHSS